MTQKLFKALFVVFLIVPMHVDARLKNKKFCKLVVKKCFAARGNAFVGGDLTAESNLIVAGSGAFGGPLTTASNLAVAGSETIRGNLAVGGSITTGSCTLTCTSTGLVVTTPTGSTTISGTGSSLGAAEFIRTIQTPNNSTPPGTAFTIDTQVFNNITGAIVASAGAGGTVYTLTAGTYVLDYEMSLADAGSVGIYTGATAGSLALDTNTVAGSSTGTTWIHGRAFVTVPTATTQVVAISSVVGTADVTTAGTDAGSFMIRLTFLKIA